MRETWLGNGNTAYPWDKKNWFSLTASKSKPKWVDLKYSSEWRGMLLVSNNEHRSKSPCRSRQDGSLSHRIIEPELQALTPKTSGKKLLNPPNLINSEKNQKKRPISSEGQKIHKNACSTLNPLVSPRIEKEYSSRHFATPEKIERSVQSKKSFSRGVLDRIGDTNADKTPLRAKRALKQEFASQIAGLPGSAKAESFRVENRTDRIKAKGLEETEQRLDSFGKSRSGNGNEQWRSSFDIIKHVITNKK